METKKSENLEAAEAAYSTELLKSISIPGLPLPENWETRKRLVAQLDLSELSTGLTIARGKRNA